MSAAANLLRRAVMLLPTEDRTRLALLPQLAEALMEIGEFPWAMLFLDEATELASGDPRLEADLVLTRLLVRHHVEENLEHWREEVAREAERLIPVLQEQRADAELAQGLAAARVRTRLGLPVRRRGGGREGGREARASCERSAARGARNVSSYTMAALYGPTPAREAIEHCEHLITEGLSDRQA